MKIEITASKELTEMHLDALIGKKGILLEPNNHQTGYFVKLDKVFQDYDEWFIPNQSIKHVEH